MLQAQIGGIDYAEFERNNLTATRLVLDAIRAGSVDSAGAYQLLGGRIRG